MKTSIVIPVYNVAPWIEECLKSLFAQTGSEYPEYKLECIVVDDCGIDGSMEIVERMAQSARCAGIDFHIVSHIRNRGLAAARNTGTAVTTGDYLFYLDGDDRLPAGALARMMNTAVEAEYPDWVQGNFHRIDAHGHFVEDTVYYNPAEPVSRSREAVVQNFGRLNFTNVTNKLILRDFITENRLSFKEGLIYEDALWCMQAYPAVRTIATLPGATYVHNMREGSTMRSTMSTVKLDSLLYIIRDLCAMPGIDANIEHAATYDAVYGLKHLYLWSFPRKYRGQWLRDLWATGVTRMQIDRQTLPPFSRLVSQALRLPRIWARLWLGILVREYRLYLNIKGEKA